MNGLVLHSKVVRHPKSDRITGVEVSDGETTLCFYRRIKPDPNKLPVVCGSPPDAPWQESRKRLPGWQFYAFAEEAMKRFGIEPPHGYTGRQRGRRWR